MTNEPVQHEQALRLQAVLELIGLRRGTVLRLIAEGGFPRPVVVSPRGHRWLRSEVLAWLAARPRHRAPEGGAGGSGAAA
jgi:prophage regulatory protein